MRNASLIVVGLCVGILLFKVAPIRHLEEPTQVVDARLEEASWLEEASYDWTVSATITVTDGQVESIWTETERALDAFLVRVREDNKIHSDGGKTLDGAVLSFGATRSLDPVEGRNGRLTIALTVLDCTTLDGATRWSELLREASAEIRRQSDLGILDFTASGYGWNVVYHTNDLP